MKRLAMAGVLGVAAVAALPASARADVHVSGGVVITAGDRDYRDGDYRQGQYHGDWRGVGASFRYGYDRGFREGSDEGSHDGRHNRDPRYWREGEYRDADKGYKGWMGPRFEYARGFREGYQAGYRRAYAASRPGWDDRGRDRWGHDGRYDPYYPDRRGDERYRDDRGSRRDDER